jgi:hypothetical protein
MYAICMSFSTKSVLSRDYFQPGPLYGVQVDDVPRKYQHIDVLKMTVIFHSIKKIRVHCPVLACLSIDVKD